MTGARGARIGAACATPVRPRRAVDNPIVLAARRPSARRGGDASSTSTPLLGSRDAGASPGSRTPHQTTAPPPRPPRHAPDRPWDTTRPDRYVPANPRLAGIV